MISLCVAALCLTPCLSGAETPQEPLDYALSAQCGAWLHHVVYGDPSFDAFIHAPGNPILRGAPPFEWPVNGFLFIDPKSGDWFVYAGLYPANYAIAPDKQMICVVFRSRDKGASWERLGPVFPETAFYFEGNDSPVTYAPDVSVVYDGNRYHMAYDFATKATTWDTIMEPSGGADNGIAYAWSEKPEGPFIRSPKPIYSTRAHPYYREKYRRAYAQTLIRRANDWLVLAMMDSGPHFSWALVGMTAQRPEGPYSEPVFLRSVDETGFHPPLLEFYPAFRHEDRIYAPATSVALNRNFQCVFRAQVEEAHDPAAWSIEQCGSVWHADDVEHEKRGIWGQTFSGAVDGEGQLRAMFPSRDSKGMGTLNIASRPWAQPYLERGFVLSGHEGPSLSLLKGDWTRFKLEVRLAFRGIATLCWAYHAPLGPNKPAADATLHPLMLTRYAGLEMTSSGWRIIEVNDAGDTKELGAGNVDASLPVALTLESLAGGTCQLSLNGQLVWQGESDSNVGAIGVLAAKNTHIRVEQFLLSGEAAPGQRAYLATEAILGAGASSGKWKSQDNTAFRYGTGAVSVAPDARGKWNVTGSAFRLWAPKGPGFGKGRVVVDGQPVATLDFHADVASPSAPVFHSEPLTAGPHAILLESTEGSVPLDCIEVTD